jgi:hypothetical protein
MGKPAIITVNGTGVPDPFGPGFSGDMGRYLSPAVSSWVPVASQFFGPSVVPPPPPIYWQPTGYPAAVAQMGASMLAGVDAISANVDRMEQEGINGPGDPLSLSGYSQGAMVTGYWAVNLCLNPNGKYHNRLADVQKGGIVQYGDPYRCPGIARGNDICGVPVPGTQDGAVTGGISGPLDLTQEQTDELNLKSCALPGDLYASAPVGSNPWTAEASAGKVGTSIFAAVQSFTFMKLVRILLDVFTPIGMIEEIYNGMQFASQGTNAPHWRYEPFVVPMSNWILKNIGA